MSGTGNPLRGWAVDREQITFVGRDLQRPECVLAEPDGTLWSADARGGVMRIDPDGAQTLIAQEVVEPGGDADSVSRYILDGTLPNGLAFDASGDFIIANFGTDAVERMTRDGVSETLLETLDGKPLGKANFALTDSRGRIWITVHTRSSPWLISVNEKLADGYIILIDERGARIAADGFVGTNEIRFDAAEEWLYVVESNARHISRLRVDDDGSLHRPRGLRASGSGRHPRRIRLRRGRQPLDHACQRRSADRAHAGAGDPHAARRRRRRRRRRLR